MKQKVLVKAIGAAVAIVLGLVGAALLLREQSEQNRLPPEVVELLEAADSFVLLSLDPNVASADMFHEHAVMGRLDIRDAVQRRELLQALHDGIANAEDKIGMCWMPRHGIRAALGAQTVDLVICFECWHLEWHMAERSGTVLTTRSPREALSGALAAAGVPMRGAPK